MEWLFAIPFWVCVGMVIGWVFLPEPAFIRAFFVRIGWAKPRVM